MNMTGLHFAVWSKSLVIPFITHQTDSKEKPQFTGLVSVCYSENSMSIQKCLHAVRLSDVAFFCFVFLPFIPRITPSPVFHLLP